MNNISDNKSDSTKGINHPTYRKKSSQQKNKPSKKRSPLNNGVLVENFTVEKQQQQNNANSANSFKKPFVKDIDRYFPNQPSSPAFNEPRTKLAYQDSASKREIIQKLTELLSPTELHFHNESRIRIFESETIRSYNRNDTKERYIVQSQDQADEQYIKMNDTKINQWQWEIILNSEISHDNLLTFVKTNRINDYTLFYYEDAEYIDIQTLCQDFNSLTSLEKKAHEYFMDILKLIYFFHKNMIAFRGIFPDNITVTKDADLKLISKRNILNMNQYRQQNEFNDNAIFPPAMQKPAYYVPPEKFITNLQDKNILGFDIWSAGVLLYEMLLGFEPFHNINKHTPLNGCKSFYMKKFDQVTGANLTDQIKDLLQKMLEIDVAKRITIDGVLDHPWVKMGFRDSKIGPFFQEIKQSGPNYGGFVEVDKVTSLKTIKKFAFLKKFKDGSGEVIGDSTQNFGKKLKEINKQKNQEPVNQIPVMLKSMHLSENKSKCDEFNGPFSLSNNIIDFDNENKIKISQSCVNNEFNTAQKRFDLGQSKHYDNESLENNDFPTNRMKKQSDSNKCYSLVYEENYVGVNERKSSFISKKDKIFKRRSASKDEDMRDEANNESTMNKLINFSKKLIEKLGCGSYENK